VIVILHLWIGSETLIVLFYTFRLSKLCILHSWRWPYICPKHLAVQCVYQVIPIYLVRVLALLCYVME